MKDDGLLSGVDAWRHRWRGRRIRWQFDLKVLRRRAEAIEQRTLDVELLDGDDWAEMVKSTRAAVANRRSGGDAVIDEATAVLAVLMQRATGRKPYLVQLMGALAMQRGWLIEMATGEGKTLTAALTAVLWAWRWERCHVVTSNDYLAERDAAGLRTYYEAAGLQCGFITATMAPEERRQNYRCAITYTTGQQVLADVLRDQLEFSHTAGTPSDRLLGLIDPAKASLRLVPPLSCALVDEADSVLADDAVTPLIISKAETDEDLKKATVMARELSLGFKIGRDFSVDEVRRSVVLFEPAQEAIRGAEATFPPSWRAAYRVAFLVTKALAAEHLYRQGRHYVVVDGKVVIVDERTGRLMPQTSWSDGLHQAVEAKAGVDLTDPTKASIKMTFQTYFRSYPRLSGMSGTLADIADEFWRIYELPMGRIPSRLPRRHQREPNRIFASAEARWQAVMTEIEHQRARDRAVLVGTRSIEDSQLLGAKLAERGIDHVVLNALEHDHEALIVTQAGIAGRVTIATNMAGRGTDIMLDDVALAAGGLHVIGTERHDSRRVDAQLVGRASRQGEPGSSVFLLSLEDTLMREALTERWREWGQSTLRMPGWALGWLGFIRLRQWQLERRSSALRISLLLHEQKLAKALSFATRRGRDG